MDRIRENPAFQTTMWSVVIRAGGIDEQQKRVALDQICRSYWKPLFVFCIREGRRVQDAEDLTQSFFAHLLARETLRVADPQRGRFRSFLLTSFRNFMAGEWDRNRAGKRGGTATHFSFDAGARGVNLAITDGCSPEQAYDRQWAFDLVERATSALRIESMKNDRGRWFDLISGPTAGTAYEEVAAELNTTEEAVKSFAKRARRRFRQLIEREIADTVSSPGDAADEMAYLVEILRG